MTKLAPFEMHDPEEDGGPWSLLLPLFSKDANNPDVTAAFEEAQRQPDGHGWHALAVYVLEELLPQLAEGITCECETDAFAVYGDDREAVLQLGEQLAALFHDPADLLEALRATPVDIYSAMFGEG